MSTPQDAPAAAESLHEISRAARSAFFWVASTSVAWQLCSWALTLLTARILTPEDYGIAALPGTVIPYLVLVGNVKLDIWMVQAKAIDERAERAMLTLALLTGTLATTIALIAAPFIAAFYNRPDLDGLFALCSLTFVFQSIQLVPEAMLKRELRFKAVSLISLVVNLSQGVITLGGAYLGFGYWALVLGVICRQALRAAAILYVRPWPRGFVWDTVLFRQALEYGLPAAGAAALAIIFTTADEVVIGKLFGTEVLGFYSMAFFFSQLPMSKIQMVIGSLLVPFYSRVKNAGHEVAPMFLRVSRAVFAVAAPSLVGLALVAPDAVQIILGEKWLPMSPALRVLCLVGVMQSVTVSISPLLDSLGHPKDVFRYNLASTIMLPGAFIIAGTNFGIEGVYFAWLSVYPFVAALMIRALSRRIKVRPVEYLLNFHGPVVSALIMAAAVAGMKILVEDLPVYARFSAEVVTGAAVYVGAIWTLYREQANDILRLRSEIRRKPA